MLLCRWRFARKWTNPYNIFKVKRICFIRNSKLINNNEKNNSIIFQEIVELSSILIKEIYKLYFFIINNIINIDDKKNKNILKNQC